MNAFTLKCQLIATQILVIRGEYLFVHYYYDTQVQVLYNYVHIVSVCLFLLLIYHLLHNCRFLTDSFDCISLIELLEIDTNNDWLFNFMYTNFDWCHSSEENIDKKHSNIRNYRIKYDRNKVSKNIKWVKLLQFYYQSICSGPIVAKD